MKEDIIKKEAIDVTGICIAKDQKFEGRWEQYRITDEELIKKAGSIWKNILKEMM